MLLFRNINFVKYVVRFASSNSKSQKKLEVVLTDNGSTFVAWHPKRDFPYEFTKPLPKTNEEENKGQSILKNEYNSKLMEFFKKKSPEQARQELMNITYTTKHRWFPRARDKRAKKTPMDREYL